MAAARRLVLVTGLSGAGRSSALKALEDEGYEAIDNLPLSLVEQIVPAHATSTAPLAVAVDVRSREFEVEAFRALVERLRQRRDLETVLVFLDADNDQIQRRFTETRRRHPLAVGRSVEQGIAIERQMMVPIRDSADLVVDTTQMNGADLRRLMAGNLVDGEAQRLAIFVTSFSYRSGLPRNADLVLDVRFLSNPHYVDALRPKTGRDPEVAAHIRADPAYGPFEERLMALLDHLLPGYEHEGKRYLTIAIGCTGGRHRSVFVAERLAALLSEGGRRVSLQHRDLAS